MGIFTAEVTKIRNEEKEEIQEFRLTTNRETVPRHLFGHDQRSLLLPSRLDHPVHT